MDVKRYPRFRRPGHAVTGDRTKTSAEKRAQLGDDFFHAYYDHSRIAYGELLADERAATTTAFVERALAWFEDLGVTTRRVMTDGAWSYTHNRSLRELFASRGIRHIVTPPYTPRWNGKVERFHQTMEREWAKGQRYRNHHARNITPAAPLQRAQTPQLTRRPPADHPRSQPPRAGQLARGQLAQRDGHRRALAGAHQVQGSTSCRGRRGDRGQERIGAWRDVPPRATMRSPLRSPGVAGRGLARRRRAHRRS